MLRFFCLALLVACGASTAPLSPRAAASAAGVDPLSEDEVQQQLVAEVGVAPALPRYLPITRAAVRLRFERDVLPQLADRVVAREIVLNKDDDEPASVAAARRLLANKLAAKARSGVAFDKLVQEYSQDDMSRGVGGRIGDAEGALPTAFITEAAAAQALAARDGAVIGPFEDDTRVVILKVDRHVAVDRTLTEERERYIVADIERDMNDTLSYTLLTAARCSYRDAPNAPESASFCSAHPVETASLSDGTKITRAELDAIVRPEEERARLGARQTLYFDALRALALGVLIDERVLPLTAMRYGVKLDPVTEAAAQAVFEHDIALDENFRKLRDASPTVADLWRRRVRLDALAELIRVQYVAQASFDDDAIAEYYLAHEADFIADGSAAGRLSNTRLFLDLPRKGGHKLKVNDESLEGQLLEMGSRPL